MTTQIHQGPGDNVAGPKYETIIHSVQTRDLKSVVDNIMCDICYRNISIALEKLNVLTEIESVESDVKLLLSAIQLKLELCQGSVPSNKKVLLALLRSPNLSVDVLNVVMSILIDLESRTDIGGARERYASLDTNNAYINEVFFERIASKDEISEQFTIPTKNDLLDQELAGLIRGALRLEEFELAVEISHFLNKSFQSTNSRALLFYSETCFIVIQNQNDHFLTLKKQAKDRIDELIAQLPDSINSSDPRYIPSLLNLLKITFFLDRRLIELGTKCIDEVRKLDEKSAETLLKMSLTNPVSKTNFDLASNTINQDDFMDLNYAIEHNLVSLTTVKTWLDNGGDIQLGDEYYNSFAELQLRVLVGPKDDKYGILSLEKRAKDFLLLDKGKLLTLNPFAIIRLCDKFIDFNLPLIAVEYLSHFVPDESWVSPLFECYLHALIAGEKYELFLSTIKHLLLEDKNFTVCIREAQLYERTGKYVLSVNAARSAIAIAPNSPYAWNLLLFSSRMAGKSVELLKEIIFEIPEELFLSFHESTVPLINEIATYIDVNIADRILADWFVQDPDAVALPLSQIHCNSLIHASNNTINPYMPKYCGDGVRYTDGFTTFNHILVTGLDSNHASLLNVDSPKGKVLQNLKVGDTIFDPVVGEITLLERLPPYVAVFRMASELRNKGNDGTDVFHLLSMPTNQDEILPFLQRFLKRFSKDEKAQAKALENPNIPLVMRSNYTDSSSPVKGAVNHLTLANSTRHIKLFNKGDDNPKKVILDIHTIVYFSLIGQVANLLKSSLEIIVSQQTKLALEFWIKDTLREDYLTLDWTEQGIQRRTSEDIKRDSMAFIEDLKQLVDYSKVEALNPSDTPDELIKIKGFIDETVYSTLQLSAANNISLLCIDHVMCTLVHHSGYPVANIYSMLLNFQSKSSLELKKKGYQLSLFRGTPLPILYDDIVELSLSKDDLDVLCIAKFIEKYGVPNESFDISLSFLVEVLGRVTSIAFLEGSILKGGRCHNPTYDGYVEHVFNFGCGAAIKSLSGNTSESRLALLISALLSKFGVSRDYISLILWLASAFAEGHFLDINEVNKAIEELSQMSLKK